MKVLVISPYRDGTGYGRASIDNILAMDAAGITVVPRPLKLNNHTTNLPDRILELENNSPAGADFVIQHTLPDMMEYCGKFKANIAMYCSETSNFKSSQWASKLNLMDVAWVPNDQMIESGRNSHVTIPMKKIHYPTDVSKFERSYKSIKIEGLEEGFTFYTISEMNKRKNFKAILQAFHTEFDPSEPVNLVIKTHRHGMDAAESRKHIEADCKTIKDWLKLYPKEHFYKKEIILTDILAEESLYRVHATCDCFVSTSFGEAWSLPAFDAMGFGKTPIVTNWGGFKEYIDNDTGWLVDCVQEQVLGVNDSFDYLYTGKETWASVSIDSLRKCMREAYSNKQARDKKAELGIDKVYNFSYQNIGSLIKKELESYE